MINMNTFFIILGITINLIESSPHELCKSKNGFMTLSENSDFVSVSEDENGMRTIFIKAKENSSETGRSNDDYEYNTTPPSTTAFDPSYDYDYYYEDVPINDPDYKDETFTFFCHKYSNTKSTKIMFGSENTTIPKLQQNPAKRVLNFTNLVPNNCETNTEPYTVKCEDVCEINIVVIMFDASDELCRNDTKSWKCGIDKLDDRLSCGNEIRTGDGKNRTYNVQRDYEVKNPASDEPAFINCGVHQTLHPIELCLQELIKLNAEKDWYPEKVPFPTVVKMRNLQNQSINERGLLRLEYGDPLYMLKQFDPTLELPESNGSSSLTLIFIICILTFLVLTIAGIYVCKKRRKRMLQPIKSDAEKEFDVFISYSNLDKEFVEDFIVPNLEGESNNIQYQCLLHERDFVPGLPIIDQINDAVNKSSCTMIILSTNFIESHWARQEFDIAESKGKVIVVVKDTVPPKEDIPISIYNYIQSTTYLSSSDVNFLKKLKKVLPHKGLLKPKAQSLDCGV